MLIMCRNLKEGRDLRDVRIFQAEGAAHAKVLG